MSETYKQLFPMPITERSRRPQNRKYQLLLIKGTDVVISQRFSNLRFSTQPKTAH